MIEKNMIGLTHIIIAALLLTMPQGVAGGNSHRNENRGVNRKGNSDGRMIVISSEHLRCDDTLLVFSPSGKEKARDLPVLFLLHGWSGNYTDWSRNKDLQKLADLNGFRIICPDGFYDSWYVDNADPGKMQWRKFFWEELWPEADRMFGLNADRTFIDGLSMGGHGAMNIFLDRPDLFRGAGSMTGVLDLRSSGGSRERIAEILGGRDINDEVCTRQSAINRLDRIALFCPSSAATNRASDQNAVAKNSAAATTGKDAAKKLLVVTCGQQDTRFFEAAKDFVEKCTELNIRHISMFSPARHRWPYWCWVIDQHLNWFRQEISGEGIGEGER